jgi:hypothetical protein
MGIRRPGIDEQFTVKAMQILALRIASDQAERKGVEFEMEEERSERGDEDLEEISRLLDTI